MRFNRGLRAWRAYIVSRWNRRDPAFSMKMVREENPRKGGSDRTERRKSDKFVVCAGQGADPEG
jgi:hypothetical protein